MGKTIKSIFQNKSIKILLLTYSFKTSYQNVCSTKRDGKLSKMIKWDTENMRSSQEERQRHLCSSQGFKGTFQDDCWAPGMESDPSRLQPCNTWGPNKLKALIPTATVLFLFNCGHTAQVNLTHSLKCTWLIWTM